MVTFLRFMLLITMLVLPLIGCKEKPQDALNDEESKFKRQIKVNKNEENSDQLSSHFLNGITSFSGSLKLVLENQDLKGIANICDFSQGLYIDEYKCTRDFILNSLDDGPALDFPVWGVADFAENDPNIVKSKVTSKEFLWGSQGYFTKLAGTGLNQVYKQIIEAPDHPSLMEAWEKELNKIRKQKARWFVWDDTSELRLVNCTNPDLVISFSGNYDDLKLVEITTIYGIEP